MIKITRRQALAGSAALLATPTVVADAAPKKTVDTQVLAVVQREPSLPGVPKILWNDWQQLLIHMVDHIQRTGHKLLSADEPLSYRLGWVALDENDHYSGWWVIDLNEFRHSRLEMDPGLRKRFEDVIGDSSWVKTPDGRIGFSHNAHLIDLGKHKPRSTQWDRLNDGGPSSTLKV